jgi:hypothetical protein
VRVTEDRLSVEPPRLTCGSQADARWRKSTWSAANGNCLEFAELPGDVIGVRDSKDNAPDRPILVFARAEWESFIAGVVAGEFDAGNGGSRP